jgi:hypothetical protein
MRFVLLLTLLGPCAAAAHDKCLTPEGLDAM